jgi:hypothetical protein
MTDAEPINRVADIYIKRVQTRTRTSIDNVQRKTSYEVRITGMPAIEEMRALFQYMSPRRQARITELIEQFG